MKAEYLNRTWNFTEDVEEGDSIRCPECLEFSSISEWTETEVGCEDCGSHSAIRCPKCDEAQDHVWCPKIEVRKAQ